MWEEKKSFNFSIAVLRKKSEINKNMRSQGGETIGIGEWRKKYETFLLRPICHPTSYETKKKNVLMLLYAAMNQKERK